MVISAVSPLNLKSSYSNGAVSSFQGKNKGKSEHHPLLAVASAMVPGTGQFLSGRIFAGVKYVSVAVVSALAALGFFLSALGVKNNKLRLAGGFTALAVGGISHIFNIHDAYRGGK